MPNPTPLAPALTQWLQHLHAAAASPAPALTPASVRTMLAKLTALHGGEGPDIAADRDAVIAIESDRINGHPLPAGAVPIRVFDPAPETSKGVLVYLHGGGHTAGSVAVYAPILRRLCAATQQLVVAVDYRLAPEHPYPTGLHDCIGTLRALPQWLQAQGYLVNAEVTLAGDSAGGALTATISALASSRSDVRVDRQVLIYPSLDYTMAHPSIDTLGSGYLLEKPRIAWYFDNYLPAGEDRQAASPLHMPVAGLPPTLLISAGYCPLRDEALAYRNRLQSAGVHCQHLHLPDVLHACLNLHELVPQQCTQTYRAIADFVHATRPTAGPAAA